MSKVAVFGAGSWGTAFSVVLADAGNEVTLWGRREELCADDQREAREHRLPARASSCPTPIARHPRPGARRSTGAEVVVLAVPSQTLRAEPRAEWADAHPARRRAGVA